MNSAAASIIEPHRARQITQLLNTFIEREKLQKRVNAQEA